MKKIKVFQLLCLLFISRQCYGMHIAMAYFGSSFYIVQYVTQLYEKISYDLQQVDDQELLAAYEIIRAGLGVDEVRLYSASQKFSTTAYESGATTTALYRNLDVISKKGEIVLLPSFFLLSRPSKVQVLIHELRHHMQYTQHVGVTLDVVNFCEKYGFDDELQRRKCLLGRLHIVGHECQETDADSFAYNQFDCSDCLKIMQGLDDLELRKKGYIRGSDINPFIQRAQKNIECCNAHNTFKNSRFGDYTLVDFIPLQLVRKAQQYKKDKEFYDKRLMEIERVVQQGWES